MERASGGRGCELEVASSSRGGYLNPNRCCDRGETFGTGCTEGFSGTENYKENAVKTRKSITKFSTLESVMKLKLFCI